MSSIYGAGGSGRRGEATAVMNPSEPERALRYVFGRGSAYEAEIGVSEALQVLTDEDELVHPDQRMFQVVHLITEYLWYTMHYELRRVMAALDRNERDEARVLLDRVVTMVDAQVGMLKLLLRHLTQQSLLVMRMNLPNDATGLDSPGGSNLRKLAVPLWRRFVSAVEREGTTVVALARLRLKAEVERTTLSPVEQELGDLYDSLHAFDQCVLEWRQLHVHLAWTQLGGSPGGAVDGEAPVVEREAKSLRGRPVSDLERIASKPLFPEQWGIPNLLFDEITAEPAGGER
jgi:tryptophan 2,3-dioxygenase